MQTIVSDVLINYEVVGKKSSKTLLILHGWGRSISEWLPIANVFSDRYQVYVIDLPGFGSSVLPAEVEANTQWFANIVTEFIKKLKLKNVTGLGHSFGGKILQVIEGQNHLFNQLILVDASGVEERPLSTKIKIAIYKRFKRIIFLFPFSIKSRIITWFNRSYYKYSPEVRESLKQVVTEDVSTFVKKIATSTLIIWGENDQTVPIKYAKYLRSLIEGSTLRIVWGARHSPHQEKTDRFVRILTEYL